MGEPYLMYFCRPSGEGDLRADAILHYYLALHYRATHGEVCRLDSTSDCSYHRNIHYHKW